MRHPPTPACGCGRTRRTFLADIGMGFTGLALGALLHRDGVLRAAAPPLAALEGAAPKARARSVIWIFLCLMPGAPPAPARPNSATSTS